MFPFDCAIGGGLHLRDRSRGRRFTEGAGCNATRQR